MEKHRKKFVITDEMIENAAKRNFTKPVRKINLTPEEEKHWAEVRAKIAEARAKGEL